MTQFVVSARKYRPDTFDSVVGQESVTDTLKSAIETDHLAHAYLFCGPRGTGKTTCARIFAKTINCENLNESIEPCGECESCISFKENRSYSIHEMDAASNNSIEDIRSLIEQTRIPPQIGKYSLYIIDEVHMLSASAFNAFLKTLEEPPKHAIFILATTEKHKILPTILSRCQIFDFSRMSVQNIEKHLNNIAELESISVEEKALNMIAQKADGAMRDALSIFDQITTFSNKNITYQTVIDNLNILDYQYYFNIVDLFLDEKVHEALILFDKLLKRGFEAQHFVLGLAKHMRDLMVCSDSITIELFDSSTDIKKSYIEQSKRCSKTFLVESIKIAMECDNFYKQASDKRLHVEIMLMKLCQLSAILKKKR